MLNRRTLGKRMICLVVTGMFALAPAGCGIYISDSPDPGESSTNEAQEGTADGTGTDAADNADSSSAADKTDASSGGDNADTSSGADDAENIASGESATLTISAVGDCTLGMDENATYSTSLVAKYEEEGASYFFAGVYDVLSADDLTIANFEGVLTESEDREDKTFAFKGDPEYTQILTEGSVEAVNLANNHSRDYGEDSYTDTITYLDEAGIESFGYDRYSIVEVNGVQVGMIGIYELAEGSGCEDDLLEMMEEVEKAGAELIIVSFHWGTELETTPDETQVALAHAAIDAGADLVLGHHPHVLQGIEVYEGKNIVYSLGNFCFGGNSNPSDKDTMIFQQTFTVTDGEVADDNVTNIVPCSLSSTSSSNDYQPTVLTGDEADEVLAKIEELSEGLSEE